MGDDSIGHCEKIGSYKDAFLNGYQDRAVGICRPNSDYCLWCWMKRELYKRKVDIPDELLAGTLDAAASVRKREDKLRRTTRDLRTPVAKCTEAGGWIFKHLL